jgi:plastocyanin
VIKNLLIGLGVLLAVVVAGSSFLGTPKPGVKKPPAATVPAQEDTSAKNNEVKISVREFSFTPSTITVNKGERVRITLTNDGAASHNLSVQGMGISTKTIGPGESDSVDFTPAVAGSFTFVCTVDSHKDLGLTGTLEVK